jgi:hypothetical protein
LLTRCLVSQTASFTRSIPRTKIKAPTSITAISLLSALRGIRRREGLTNIANRRSPYEQQTSRRSSQEESRETSSSSNAVKENGIDVHFIVWSIARISGDRGDESLLLHRPCDASEEVRISMCDELLVKIYFLIETDSWTLGQNNLLGCMRKSHLRRGR